MSKNQPRQINNQTKELSNALCCKPPFFSYFKFCELQYANCVYDEGMWFELAKMINNAVTKDKYHLWRLFNYLASSSEKINFDYLIYISIELELDKRKDDKFKTLSDLWKSQLFYLIFRFIDKKYSGWLNSLKNGDKFSKKTVFECLTKALGHRIILEYRLFDCLWRASQRLHPFGKLVYKKFEF